MDLENGHNRKKLIQGDGGHERFRKGRAAYLGVPVEDIERVIDDLETKGSLYEKYAAVEGEPGIFIGAKSVCRYAVDQLKKVLDDYGRKEKP